MSVVAFDAVTLELAGRTILSDVGFAIEPSEFVGLLGPNGAGKTTLIRAILGLVRPRRGRISVLGREAVRGNPAVGYLPQVRGQTDLKLSGWDFVASSASGHRWGLPRLATAERHEVALALDLVGATALAERPLGELSGGERQRLLLSQALLGRPKLLLLDEPLVNLDPTHQRGVIDLVARLNRELGCAVLFSAHELNPLLGAMHRVLYVGRGQAVLGTVDEVITGPVLSRLYGSEIEVLRIGRRIFVMAGDNEAEGEAHRHDDDGHGPHPHGDHGPGAHHHHA
ncbi:MAG TPA: ATP-binding cassette domain-containing protein [Lichenihabitans sp.]|jgi:zinc/manganese transport system ATP-binding protein|nr:ATP-binding cassette domain-containing protein [Lichenihabitans sp.]